MKLLLLLSVLMMSFGGCIKIKKETREVCRRKSDGAEVPMSTCAAQLSAEKAGQTANPKFLTASIKLQINVEKSEKNALITILENKSDKVAGKNNSECEITSHVGQTLNLSMLGSLLKVEDENGKSLYYFSTIRKANSFYGTWARATQPGEGKGWIYLIMNSDSSLTLTKNCDL